MVSGYMPTNNREDGIILLTSQKTSFAARGKALALVCGALVALSLCLSACGLADTGDTGQNVDTTSEEATTDTTATNETRLFIIDTDTGADDASALMLAAKLPHIEVLGVTTLAGNVDLEQSTRNALAALEAVGYDAPVYRGSDTSYQGVKFDIHSVMGTDGMGDCDLVHPTGTATDGDAVDFILDTVAAHPHEVEILAIGPATNLALALDRDEETMKLVKAIWSMGTCGLGPGNATPVSEFNVYVDAAAYKRLLDSGIAVNIIGLDAVDFSSALTADQLDKLEELGGPCAFVGKSFRKLFDFYVRNGSTTVSNYDAVAALAAFCPDFVQATATYHGEVIVEPGTTYGQVVFFRQGFTYDMPTDDYAYNVILVRSVDGASFFDRLTSVLTS